MNPTLARELEQFIYREADLLDHRRYDDWLKLMTDDVLYWVPNFRQDGDLGEVGVIAYERLDGLRARVARVQHELNPTQRPPPRTLHFLTNIISSGEGDGVAEVTSNVLLYVSKDKQLVQFPARNEHKLRKVDGNWRICQKKVNLLGSDLPVSQLPLL